MAQLSSTIITGSLYVTDDVSTNTVFRGNLVGTASHASFAPSSSASDTASFSFNADSASWAPTPVLVPSASFATNALTASMLENFVQSPSASWASQSLSASIADTAITSDFAVLAGDLLSSTASYAVAADFALVAASLLNPEIDVSASYAITASLALEAEYSLTAGSSNTAVSAAYAETSAFANNSTNALAAQTASYVELAQTASYIENAQSASFVQMAVSASHLTGEGEVSASLYFQNIPTPPSTVEGQVFYDSTEHALTVGQGNGVSLQIGTEMYIRCHNKTGAQINNGQVVTFANSTTGQRPDIKLAIGDGLFDYPVIGVATQDIPHGEDGYICTNGYVHDLDTDTPGWEEGDFLWLSKTTSGSMTTVHPTYPDGAFQIAVVVYKHQNNGIIFVKPDRHFADSAITASYAISASTSVSASNLAPGAMLWVVSGSNGVAPAFLAPYDYSADNVYRPLPIREGWTHWDHKWNDWAVYDDSGARTHLGREVVFAVHNPTAQALPRMAAVYISGSSPSLNPTWSIAYKPDVYLAIADGTGTKSNVVGIVRQAIPSGSDGYVLQTGTIHNSNVSGYGDVGTQLWLSPTVPGGLTTTKPGQPNEVVSIGYVIEGGTVGSLLVQTRPEPPPANAYAGITAPVVFTDNTSSYEISLSTSSVNLYSNTEGIGAITQYPVEAATFTIPNSTSASFIYAEQSGSVAVYKVTSNSDDINGITRAAVATVYRADEDAHVMANNEEGLALANKLQIRLLQTDKFSWQSGFTLYDTGSRQFFITAGKVWYGATQLTEDDFDSRLTGSVPIRETHFAYHSASTWVIPTAVDGKWENGYYDDGTQLVALSSGSYTTVYFYRILGSNDWDEDVFYLLGNNEYATLAEAQASVVPSDIPSVLSDVSICVGRFIVQSGSSTPTAIESSFTTNFGQSAVSVHNNLAGLQGGQGGEYYHMTLADYTGTGTGVMVRQDNALLSSPQFNAATPGHIPYWSPTQRLTLTGSVQVFGDEHVLINSASFPDANNPETLLIVAKHTESVNIVGAYGNTNDFCQIWNQNQSTGSNASTDIVATANNGTQLSAYADMGIASNNYSDARWPWVKPNDSYVECDGGDLWVATLSDKAIRFVFNNTASNGYADKTGFYITGSLHGTASYIATASFSQTCSYALGGDVSVTAVSNDQPYYMAMLTGTGSGVAAITVDADGDFYYNPSTSTVHADTFHGTFDGTASWAQNINTASYSYTSSHASYGVSSSIADTASYYALTYASSSLTTAITMSTANRFYDGPAVALSAGTWLVTAAGLVHRSNAGTTLWWAKINDSAGNAYVQTQQNTNINPAYATLHMSAIITLPNPAGITASFMSDVGAATIFVRRDVTVQNTGSKATYITATRLS